MNIIDTDTWEPIEGSNDCGGGGGYITGNIPKGARWAGFYVPRLRVGILKGEMFVSRGGLKKAKTLAKKLRLTLRYSLLMK